MRDVTVSEDMLINAARYALGRQTNIVRDTVNETIRAWPHLTPRAREVIRRDLESWRGMPFRTPADIEAEWVKLERHITNEGTEQ